MTYGGRDNSQIMRFHNQKSCIRWEAHLSKLKNAYIKLRDFTIGLNNFSFSGYLMFIMAGTTETAIMSGIGFFIANKTMNRNSQ